MKAELGERFGYLVVIASAGSHVHVRCDCGARKVIRRSNLGATKSCGCKRGQLIADRRRTHGHRTGYGGSRTYRSWRTMIQRCTDPRTNGYKNYGGRGISVCPRWSGSFQAFLDDMGPRPDAKTLDRRDVNGNYEPTNYRWATASQQRMNRRTLCIEVAP